MDEREIFIAYENIKVKNLLFNNFIFCFLAVVFVVVSFATHHT